MRRVVGLARLMFDGEEVVDMPSACPYSSFSLLEVVVVDMMCVCAMTLEERAIKLNVQKSVVLKLSQCS